MYGMGGIYERGAEEQSPLPDGFDDQRALVVQLLKDAYHPYSLSSPHKQDGTPRGTPDGYANINGTVVERWDTHDRYMDSHRQLRDRLERMRQLHPYYYALERVFLHDEASDRAYEDLEEKAKPALEAIKTRLNRIKKKRGKRGDQIRAWKEGMTEHLRLLMDLEVAIHDLTLNMMDLDLYVSVPAKRNPELENARPKLTVEERYAEINRIFESYCRDFRKARPGKPYRNRALEATAVNTNESKRTIQRAVRFAGGGSKDDPEGELA